MSCPACEQSRLAGKRFCSQCGAQLSVEPAQGSGLSAAAPLEPRTQWSGTYTPPPTPRSAAPDAAGPTPKKKAPVGLIAAVIALVALAALVITLFATGVIRLGGKKVDPGGGGPSKTVVEPENDGAYHVEETVLADNSILRVTLLEVSEDDGSVFFKLKLENTASDSYVVGTVVNAINDYDLNDYSMGVYSELDSGESATKTIKVEKDVLDLFGLGRIDKITLNTFAMVSLDSERYLRDEYTDVYPTGLDADSFEQPAHMEFDAEERAYRESGMSVWLVNPGVDEDGDFAFYLYGENDTRKDMVIVLDDVTVNDIPVDDIFTLVSFSGHHSYSLCWFSKEELADIGLTPGDVASIRFSFIVYDGDTEAVIDAFDYTYGTPSGGSGGTSSV